MAKKTTRRKAASGGKTVAAAAANDNTKGKGSKSGSRRKWMPRDVYQEVTDRILELLDQEIVPWHNPIRGAGGGDYPKNLASGKKYRGVNVFLLAITAMMKGYDSPYWTTFKQAKAAGGQVRKGEKATSVIFWKKLTKDGEEQEIDPETGKPARAPFVLRHYAVFNAAAQCDGLAVPDTVDLSAVPAFVKIDEAERIVREYPAPQPAIEHKGTQASYSRSLDRVRLPVPERFESGEDYYSTLFHELGHSTGIKGRCDRHIEGESPPFGSPDYSREELCAEMTAAFLNAAAGISGQTIPATVSYLDGWRKKLKGDKKLIVQAAAQAQRAADFILGESWQAALDEEQSGPGDGTAVEGRQAAAGTPQSDPKGSDRLAASPGPANAVQDKPAAKTGGTGPQLTLFG